MLPSLRTVDQGASSMKVKGADSPTLVARRDVYDFDFPFPKRRLALLDETRTGECQTRFHLGQKGVS